MGPTIGWALLGKVFQYSIQESRRLICHDRIGANSSTSVVDLNCKVWGIDNLFIVDAGIIPNQPMSNTHAAVYAVAELAVPRILALAGGP